MKIRIETQSLVIDIETKAPFIPKTLIDLEQVLDQYEPHHLEVLFEHDPAVKSANVDHIALDFLNNT